MKPAVIGACLAVCSVVAGCGTMFSVIGDSPEKNHPFPTDPGPIYGGVRFDAFATAAAFKDNFGEPSDHVIQGLGPPILEFLPLIDFPFSAAADTLALPFTVSAAVLRLGAPSPRGFINGAAPPSDGQCDRLQP